MPHPGQPLSEVIDALRAIAPLSLAESWDKVGTLVAGDGRAITRVLFAIDVTPEVLAEATASGAGLIVGYHPLLFKPLERLDGATWQGRVAIDAVRAGIAVYSPHTALDAVAGGVNDWLLDCVADAGGCLAEDRRALQPALGTGTGTHKLTTFVPEAAVDAVRNALAAAGAGRIGNYRHCSFTSSGEGTFLPESGAKPSVGRPGELERVVERRVEMVCAKHRLLPVLAALRAAHPYEEPAFEVVALEAVPFDRAVGAGRVARLSKSCFSAEIAERLHPLLGSCRIDRTGTRLAGRSHPFAHSVVAVCAGSGGSLLDAAAALGATCFLTGELSHHDVLRAHALGLEVLLAGHTNTERGYLPRFAAQVKLRLPEVDCVVSTVDRDPLQV
jgi:dinuclear metal center YbgI/SA1388 family protein